MFDSFTQVFNAKKLVKKISVFLTLLLTVILVTVTTTPVVHASMTSSIRVNKLLPEARRVYENYDDKAVIVNDPIGNFDSVLNEGRKIKARHFTINMRLISANGTVWDRIASGKYAGKWTLEWLTNQRICISRRDVNRHIVGILKVKDNTFFLSKNYIRGRIYYFVAAIVC